MTEKVNAAKEVTTDPNRKKFVVGVKFSNSGKVYPYRVDGETLRVGDFVVVETENAENFGTVCLAKHVYREKGRQPGALKRVLRRATPRDLECVQKNRDLEREGAKLCQRKVEERKIPMKLSRVEFSFDGRKATFYFTAEGRVDFRELVRDLAHHFKTKIVMKQIGVRDEARIIGGCGLCGLKLCCASFLKDFVPVSIKMAKEQNLPLNPVKISGVCGRLLCCLVYEREGYREARKKLPGCGSCVRTPSGEGRVEKVNLLLENVTVSYKDAEKEETLPLSEIKVEKREQPRKGRKREEPRRR